MLLFGNAPVLGIGISQEAPLLDNQGQFHYRDGGEAHLNNPETMVYLQVSPVPRLLRSANRLLELPLTSLNSVSHNALVTFIPYPADGRA